MFLFYITCRYYLNNELMETNIIKELYILKKIYIIKWSVFNSEKYVNTTIQKNTICFDSWIVNKWSFWKWLRTTLSFNSRNMCIMCYDRIYFLNFRIDHLDLRMYMVYRTIYDCVYKNNIFTWPKTKLYTLIS